MASIKIACLQVNEVQNLTNEQTKLVQGGDNPGMGPYDAPDTSRDCVKEAGLAVLTDGNPTLAFLVCAISNIFGW